MTDIAIGPDLAAVKQRQQATWASGDYHMIGTQILLSSELLIESLDVHAGDRVLDVATGSGNAALAAARRGCTVVGIDYVPELLERAARAVVAGGPETEVHATSLSGAGVMPSRGLVIRWTRPLSFSRPRPLGRGRIRRGRPRRPRATSRRPAWSS